MKLTKNSASLFFQKNIYTSAEEALGAVTHLAIGAHQDDIEIMAMAGIAHCLTHADNQFGAITCTSGSGSARTGAFAHYTDQQMIEVRRQEQEAAAQMGHYAFLAQLGHQSNEIKNSEKKTALHTDLIELFRWCAPEVIYTHNLMDKHDTHVALALKLIEVLRQLPPERRPKKLIGCEVWRGLDWILESDKIAMDLNIGNQFVLDMVNIFASQVEGGKRYDLATLGRMHANSTFSESHSVDLSDKRWYGIDLTPLLIDPSLSPLKFVEQLQRNLFQDINQRINRYL